MRTQPNGMGKFVQVLGSQAIMGANAAATAAHRGWHDIAGHFKAAQGVVDTSSGFTLSGFTPRSCMPKSVGIHDSRPNFPNLAAISSVRDVHVA